MDFPTMDLTATERASKRHNPSTSAAIIVPSADEVLWTATHPHDQADGFRYMQNRLGLSNAWLDQAGDFGEEQVSKYLGPSHAKQIGPWYYQMLNSLLAVKWEMKVDMAQVAKMEKVWESRKPQYVQPRSRPPSKEIIERARPHVLNEYFSEMGRKGAASTNARLTQKQRKQSASNAARARWSKQ